VRNGFYYRVRAKIFNAWRYCGYNHKYIVAVVVKKCVGNVENKGSAKYAIPVSKFQAYIGYIKVYESIVGDISESTIFIILVKSMFDRRHPLQRHHDHYNYRYRHIKSHSLDVQERQFLLMQPYL